MKTRPSTQENFMMLSIIDINTTEVPIYPNTIVPKNIQLTPQGTDDHYYLYIKSGSPKSNSKSSMSVTPYKEHPKKRKSDTMSSTKIDVLPLIKNKRTKHCK